MYMYIYIYIIYIYIYRERERERERASERERERRERCVLSACMFHICSFFVTLFPNARTPHHTAAATTHLCIALRSDRV